MIRALQVTVNSDFVPIAAPLRLDHPPSLRGDLVCGDRPHQPKPGCFFDNRDQGIALLMSRVLVPIPVLSRTGEARGQGGRPANRQPNGA
jgi:hypothetical protein